MPSLHVFRLAEHQLTSAYPLVRSKVRVSQTGWEIFAGDLTGAGGGTLGVQVNDECLYGVATFRPLHTLRNGLILDVEVLVVFDLCPATPVRRKLHEGLASIARDLGCCGIRVTVAAPGGDAIRQREGATWEKLGLELTTLGIVQPAP